MRSRLALLRLAAAARARGAAVSRDQVTTGLDGTQRWITVINPTDDEHAVSDAVTPQTAVPLAAQASAVVDVEPLAITETYAVTPVAPPVEAVTVSETVAATPLTVADAPTATTSAPSEVASAAEAVDHEPLAVTDTVEVQTTAA